MVPGTSNQLIGIASLNLGNLRSVSNAIYSLGFDYHLVESREDLDRVSHLVIPGVGSFRAGMRGIEERDLAEPIREFIAAGKPTLGICLGMQLFATRGEEGDVTRGLDVVPGTVRRFDSGKVSAIPHVGWNSLAKRREHPVLRSIPDNVDFYFVHSYHFAPAREEHTVADVDCGQRFAGVVGSANVLGFQFHPEKSQNNGLRLLDSFCRWDGVC